MISIQLSFHLSLGIAENHSLFISTARRDYIRIRVLLQKFFYANLLQEHNVSTMVRFELLFVIHCKSPSFETFPPKNDRLVAAMHLFDTCFCQPGASLGPRPGLRCVARA